MLRAAATAVLVLAAAGSASARARLAQPTFADAGRAATATLLNVYYGGGGRWRICNAVGCATADSDWGVDSLTYALTLRYRATHDPRLAHVLDSLAAAAPQYPAPCRTPDGCGSWSDVPEWDAIALADEYEATHDEAALAKAEAAYAFVEGSGAYALGACPRIRFQQPGGGSNRLKTLETEANAVKAALLLYRATHNPAYLAAARSHYSAVRAYFLDPRLPLYTAYVFDDGTTCRQLPHRFFHIRRYLADATATARAVSSELSDPRGIFADLQAENDMPTSRRCPRPSASAAPASRCSERLGNSAARRATHACSSTDAKPSIRRGSGRTSRARAEASPAACSLPGAGRRPGSTR